MFKKLPFQSDYLSVIIQFPIALGFKGDFLKKKKKC